MVSGSFAQKKLSKSSLRIKSLGLSQTPPFSTAYPLTLLHWQMKERLPRIARRRKKKVGNRKSRREQT
jgi:hypothetical protein